MIEFQFVSPKELDTRVPWVFPTLGFELCRRPEAPYFSLCLMTGRYITRFRIYWNVSSEDGLHAMYETLKRAGVFKDE
jgi:hypothetical protein